MQLKDVLIKEYDSAWNHLILSKEAKQKTLRLLFVISAALTALIVREDLPTKSLIYIPFFEVVFLVYFMQLMYRQTCASNAFDIVEKKINNSIEKDEKNEYNFDLVFNTRYLRDGYRTYYIGLIARILLILLVPLSSGLCLHVGLIEYKISGWEYWIYMLLNITILTAIALLHTYENKGRKVRHTELLMQVKSLNKQK